MATAADVIAPPVDYFTYLLALRPANPTPGGVVEGDSGTYEGVTYVLQGDVKFLKLPAKYRDYFIAASSEGGSQSISVDVRGFALGDWPLPLTYFYLDEGLGRLVGKAVLVEYLRDDGQAANLKEDEQIATLKFKKPVDKVGWFVKPWKLERAPVPRSPGDKAATVVPPGGYLEAIYAIENPLKAPTLKEELLAIDGMKIKVEAPAKFMALPDELKSFWVAPVSGGKSGAVLVDSERWKVGFLPFEKGKSKGNEVEPLKGEPIVVNGITVGWRFAKPEPSAGWFLSLGLVPQQPAEPAPKDANAP